MTYSGDSDYRVPMMESERVCSEAGGLCKAVLSLKNICIEYSRPAVSIRSSQYSKMEAE